MIQQAVLAGLTSTGHEVWDIGVAATPTTELVVAESEAVGGVIITASHNPQSWNALKFLEARGLFLTTAQNRQLQERYEAGDGHVRADTLGQVIPRDGADRQHLDGILALPWLDADQLGHRRLHAVVDAVEGAGGRIVPALLEALGVTCTPLHCGMSGRFPHNPEPTPAHLQELCATVVANGADLGLAVDPDVDRLALVDHRGQALSEELTLVLAVSFLLEQKPGPVVVNLSTTQLIEQIARRHDVPVIRTPVGEANVVEAMLTANAAIGGEGNGGVIYPALHPGRDALVGIAMVLQAMAQHEASLADLADALPPAVMIKEKIDAAAISSEDALDYLVKKLGSGTLDKRDGIKWTGEGAWVHVRPSNTEPIIRIIAEATDEVVARALIDKVRAAQRA
jgi:phosphomannomutase